MRVDGECGAAAEYDGIAGHAARGAGGTPELAPAVDDLPFTGGLVGMAGYDLVRYFERLEQLARRTRDPRVAQSGLYRGRIATGIRSSDAPHGVAAYRQRRRTRAASRRGHRLLRGPVPAPGPPGDYSEPVQSLSERDFMDAVERSKRYIASGDIYQIVLSVRFSGTTSCRLSRRIAHCDC